MVKNLNLDNFLTISRSNISKLRSYLVLTSGQKPKTSLEPFLRNISVSDFGLIWRPFREYFQIKNFFQKSDSVTFLLLQSPNFIQKIRKILRAVTEKTALPTNQLLPKTPILQDLGHAGPTEVQAQQPYDILHTADISTTESTEL